MELPDDGPFAADGAEVAGLGHAVTRASSRIDASEEPLREDAERERCLVGHDAVAEHPQSVQPMGQPISASTNRGFKTGESLEVRPPAFAVVSAGRERDAPESHAGAARKAVASSSGDFLSNSAGAPVSFALCEVGVGHIRIASVSVVPCECVAVGA